MLSCFFKQGSFYLESCVILVMKYSELGMSALFGKVIYSCLFLVEVGSPFYQFFYSVGGFGDSQPYAFFIAKSCSRYQGIFDVFFV